MVGMKKQTLRAVMGNTIHIRKMGRQALCCVGSSLQGLMATFGRGEDSQLGTVN